MKHLLAAATFAALLAAAPASAQTMYGSTVAPNNGSVGTASFDGSWKDGFQIYGTATPPPANDGGNILKLVEDGPDVYFGNLQADLAGAAVADTGTALVHDAQPINATSPVPEPATWAMMLMGFGMVGGALRSRRTAALRYA